MPRNGHQSSGLLDSELYQLHYIDRACYMSLVMRKPDFCTCENKDADQLRGNREADQRLCFRYTVVHLYNPSSIKIQNFKPLAIFLSLPVTAVQPDLCGTWSETPKTGFLTTRLKLMLHLIKNTPMQRIRERLY